MVLPYSIIGLVMVLYVATSNIQNTFFGFFGFFVFPPVCSAESFYDICCCFGFLCCVLCVLREVYFWV